MDDSWIEIVDHGSIVEGFHPGEFSSFIYNMDRRLVKLLISERIDLDDVTLDDQDLLDGRTGFRPIVLKLSLPADPLRGGAEEIETYSMGVVLFTFRENVDFKTYMEEGDPVVMGCPLANVRTYKHEDLIDLKNDLAYYEKQRDYLLDNSPNIFSDDDGLRAQPIVAEEILDQEATGLSWGEKFDADSFINLVEIKSKKFAKNNPAAVPKKGNVLVTRQSIIRKFFELGIPYEKMPLEGVFGGADARAKLKVK